MPPQQININEDPAVAHASKLGMPTEYHRVRFPWLKYLSTIVLELILGVVISYVRGEYLLVESGGLLFITLALFSTGIFLLVHSFKSSSRLLGVISVLVLIFLGLFILTFAVNYNRARNFEASSRTITLLAQVN